MDPEPPKLYPSSPLAYLPQRQADYQTADVHLSLFWVGTFFWDVVYHDYPVLQRFKLQLPYGVYILSRITTFLFPLSRVILSTFRFEDCMQAMHLAQASFILTVSLTSLLFVSRVQGVFHGNNRVVATFLVLWLILVASTFAVIPGIGIERLADSEYCIINRIDTYASSPTIYLSFFDTAVFLAISRRLTKMSDAKLAKENWWAYIRGRYIPQLPSALLRDGQSYYGVAVLANLLQLILMLAPFPTPIHQMFASVAACLTNIMACRVFRQTMRAVEEKELIPVSPPYPDVSMSV